MTGSAEEMIDQLANLHSDILRDLAPIVEIFPGFWHKEFRILTKGCDFLLRRAEQMANICPTVFPRVCHLGKSHTVIPVLFPVGEVEEERGEVGSCNSWLVY